MKKQANILFTRFSKEELENLTTVVKETLAFGITAASKKTFTAADMWNIQRQKKMVSQRRSFL